MDNQQNPSPAPFAPTDATNSLATELVGALLAPQPAAPQPVPQPVSQRVPAQPAPVVAPQLQPAPPPQPVSQQVPAQPAPQPPVYQASGDRFSGVPPQEAPQPLAEIPAEQNIQLPANTPENVGHAFAASRAEARNYRRLAEQLRSQLEAEREKAAGGSEKEAQLAREINDWQQKYNQLEDRLGKMDLSQSREFRDKYDTPISKIHAEIADVLVANGVQQADAKARAEDIMLADDPSEMLANLMPTAQGMIMYKLKDAQALWAQRDQALKEWRQTQQGLAEVSVRDNYVASAQRRAELADKAFEKLAQIAPTVQWSDPDYVPRRDEAISKAKAWYQQAPEDQIAAAAMEGFMAPFAYEEIQRLSAQVHELQGQLAGRARVSAPPVSPYFPSAPLVQPPPPPPPKPGTPEQPWTPNDTVDGQTRAAGLISAMLAPN